MQLFQYGFLWAALVSTAMARFKSPLPAPTVAGFDDGRWGWSPRPTELPNIYYGAGRDIVRRQALFSANTCGYLNEGGGFAYTITCAAPYACAVNTDVSGYGVFGCCTGSTSLSGTNTFVNGCVYATTCFDLASPQVTTSGQLATSCYDAAAPYCIALEFAYGTEYVGGFVCTDTAYNAPLTIGAASASSFRVTLTLSSSTPIPIPPTSPSSTTHSSSSSSSSHTTTSSSPVPVPTPCSSCGGGGGLSSGAKAGIGAGVGGATLIAIVAAVCVLMRRRKKGQTNTSAGTPGPVHGVDDGQPQMSQQQPHNAPPPLYFKEAPAAAAYHHPQDPMYPQTRGQGAKELHGQPNYYSGPVPDELQSHNYTSKPGPDSAVSPTGTDVHELYSPQMSPQPPPSELMAPHPTHGRQELQ